ncbi:MAG TPA: hemolysin III family protein [Gemmatimonadaceae bacterium]|nr:hemolysin III family protein [Gemmatimonadaceae bacterium]
MSQAQSISLDRDRRGGPRAHVNGWFHFAGALLAAAVLPLLVREAVARESARHLIGALAFGVTAVLMFSASALYHLRSTSPREALYQRLDHAMIYVFIAGTYTPICLVALWSTTAGRVMLAVVWALAALGVALDLRGRPLRRGQATALYLAMGWAALPIFPALRTHPRPGLWLLAGGLLYTVGAILYWRQRPRRRLGVVGFHELWHLCVLAASASHFWAIRTFVVTL